MTDTNQPKTTMEDKELREIWFREYDNPKLDDGTEKPNQLLGKFRVIHQISDDQYSEEFVGTDEKGTYYLVSELEMTGMNGGSRWVLTAMPFIEGLIAQAREEEGNRISKEILEEYGNSPLMKFKLDRILKSRYGSEGREEGKDEMQA